MNDSYMSTVGAKLDLQRQAREDTMNKRAIEVAKKKDRKALMELIQERDRMLWERNQQEKEINLRVDPVIATALNDSQRGSGA
jgi:signal transduction histidine kinase